MLPERESFIKNIAREKKLRRMLPERKSVGRILPERKGLKECCQKRNVWKVLRGGGLPENTPRCCLLCAWQCQSAAERRQDTSQ